MRKFGSIRVLCLLALLASTSALKAQTAQSPDPAITSLSVTGVVTELKPDTRQVIVKTTAGNEVTVTLSDRTTFMRIPPGEKTKDKFIPITPADFGVGDSVFARGRMTEDRKSMPALEFYVMSKADIAQKRERERDEWTKRGVAGSFQTIGGTIAEINVEKQEIKINDLQSKQPVTVVVSKDSSLRKLENAKSSNELQEMFDRLPTFTFQELKQGDSILVSSTKGADPSRITAIAIVSGVDALLKNAQGNRAVSLGNMSLGGP